QSLLRPRVQFDKAAGDQVGLLQHADIGDWQRTIRGLSGDDGGHAPIGAGKVNRRSEIRFDRHLRGVQEHLRCWTRLDTSVLLELRNGLFGELANSQYGTAMPERLGTDSRDDTPGP